MTCHFICLCGISFNQNETLSKNGLILLNQAGSSLAVAIYRDKNIVEAVQAYTD
jgi:hypothetical protein